MEYYIGYDILRERNVSVSTIPFVFNGIIVGYPFNLRELIVLTGKDMIPAKLGIYHLFNSERLVYIGMSKSIRRRLIEHLKDDDMPFDNVLWFCADDWFDGASVRDVLAIESRMIRIFKPPFNMKY